LASVLSKVTMKVIRTGGRNTKNRWSSLTLPHSRTVLRLLPARTYTRALGEVRRRGSVHMGSPAVSYEISIHRKRMPQNNSPTLWRPRFLQTISFGSFSNITFVCETNVGWTGFVNETFKISPTNDIRNFEDSVSNWNLNRLHYNMKNICPSVVRFLVFLLCGTISDVCSTYLWSLHFNASCRGAWLLHMRVHYVYVTREDTLLICTIRGLTYLI
jgi:hypothetical protein